MNELKEKLVSLGISEEMSDKAIHAVLEFVKSKLPDHFHGIIDEALSGKADLSSLGGILGNLGSLGSLFGGDNK